MEKYQNLNIVRQKLISYKIEMFKKFILLFFLFIFPITACPVAPIPTTNCPTDHVSGFVLYISNFCKAAKLKKFSFKLGYLF